MHVAHAAVERVCPFACHCSAGPKVASLLAVGSCGSIQILHAEDTDWFHCNRVELVCRAMNSLAVAHFLKPLRFFAQQSLLALSWRLP